LPDERRQFRILFRDFLVRMVDLELLSAGGDVGKLLAQSAAILAAFSFTFLAVTLGKYAGSAPQAQLLAAAQSQTEFLFATTMAVAGMFAVLVWNTVLPDIRDCAILGVLPVRLRTIFLAKLAAVCSALATGVFAINVFTGLCYPFLLLPPGASAGSALRSIAAYWLAMAAMGLFVCCALLAVQGLSALLLSHRLFLRFSIWIQLAAFFVILGGYFLKPPLALPLTLSSLRVSWAPSFWFYALFQQWSGTAPPILMPFAARGLWCLLVTGVAAAIAFALAFNRSMRRVMEQPDIAPADRSRPAAQFGRFLVSRVFTRPLDRAIVLFTARTLARSRLHRLLLAAFGGIGMAIALAYAKDLLYGYSGGLWDSLGVNGDASRYWNQTNVPFLVGSLVLLAFAIIGVRATFSLPIALRANWIFRITEIHSPAAYFSAVRKALFVLTAIPLWIAAAFVFFTIWPAQQALKHVAVLIAIGILLAEISLYRFRKIPFACSYLPGKANINVRLGAYALLFLFAADRGVAFEYWAMQHSLGFVLLFAALVSAALWAHQRTAKFANARGNRVQFEDLPPAEVFALDLRQEVDPNPGPAPLRSVESKERSNSPLIGLNLVGAPVQPPMEEPPVPFRIRFEQLMQDFRQGVRSFRRAPVFSAVAILLIALGLGANLTIYSIIHSVLSKPAPGVHARGLVMFGGSVDGQLLAGGPLNSYPNYLDLAAQTKTMSAMTASVAAPWLTLTLSDGTYEFRGEMVSPNYFQTLDVPLVRGRSFTEGESSGAEGLAAVIAYHVWQIQFHGTESIVGQHIVINGYPATIVGVAAEGFHGVGFAPHFEIGLPLIGFSRIRGTESQLFDRTWRGVTILGHLAPRTSLSQAKEECALISARLRASHPDENRGWAAVLAPYSITAFGPLSTPQARRSMAGVSLLGLLALLVVCANIASLLLGRSVAREGDIAVRLSLGASRLRIIRMLVAEGLLLSLAACLAAWPLTFFVTRAIGKLVPSIESGLRMQLDLAPDGRVLAYGIALAILATLTFTLAPSFGFWKGQARPFLKAAGHSVIRGGSRLVNTLVIAQVALCVVLVTAGSLTYQSLFYIDTSDLHFTKDHLLLASVNTDGAVAGGAENIALLERIRQRLSAIPGVARVSWATAAPPHDHGWMGLPVEALDSHRSTLTDATIVGPDYIEALGVPSLIGRDIAAEDTAGRRPTAVINRRLAAELWPGESALGRAILLFEERQPIEIVGIVPNGAFSGVGKDGAMTGIGKAERPNFVFLAEQQKSSAPGEKTFHIRYAGDLERFIPEIRAAIREVDGRVPVFSVRTMDEEFRDFTAPIRMVTILIGLFAASALLLSSVGLYAAIAFHTARRTREFGIRAALGATPWQVLRAVLKQGLVLTTAGVALGLTLAVAIARTAAGLLFGVDPADKMTYVAVVVLLAVVCLAACYLPARRASRVDPMFALRQD
jgi:predicted permease